MMILLDILHIHFLLNFHDVAIIHEFIHRLNADFDAQRCGIGG